MAELHKYKAPEIELYFSARDARERLKKALGELDSLIETHSTEEGREIMKRIRMLLLDSERILEYPMNKMGKPVKCPRCGKDTLQEIYGKITCPECGYTREF